ncbi:MAG: FKBP-type peptidyl-prolyl cis-trans isomerase [Acidimicrobiales bacterium]
MATTKRERQKAARRIKLEAMQKRAKRRQNLRRGIIVGIVAVVVLGTGALLFSSKTTTTTTTTTAPTTTTTAAAAVNPASIHFTTLADPSPAGVWGKAPTLVVPPGNPPTKPELANLITGTGPGAVDGDKFTVEYELATYSTRKVIQSSWSSKAFSDTLEPGGLIPGWVEGMQGMKVGGRRELILPPVDGYGASSPGTGIAANDTLIFIIDLLKLSK